MSGCRPMIRDLLGRDEGKTLEFKENARSLGHIIKTVVALANTAGGALVIGVRDRTKEVVGVKDALAEEERLASAVADSIRPQLLVDVQLQSWRDREVLILTVPHSIGPHHVRTEGPEQGVYVRLGSTNRRAGPEVIAEIRRLARNVAFDEQPCPEVNSEAIDFRAASELFSELGRPVSEAKLHNLGLMVRHCGRDVPSMGAVLLFGKTRSRLFPDAVLRCARFAGRDRARFLDHAEIDEYLPGAVEHAIRFIERHTIQGIEIGRLRHRDTPEYLPAVLREAVTNAVVHADYSTRGSPTQIAVFDDRIEITNPGPLPFGLTLEAAVSGVSKLRNRVIGRVFRELGLIEQWGTGIGRMLAECEQNGVRPPTIEEIGAFFRVTLYSARLARAVTPEWQRRLVAHLQERGDVTTRDAAEIWRISARTARTRLLALVNRGVIAEIGTGPTDPFRKYILRKTVTTMPEQEP